MGSTGKIAAISTVLIVAYLLATGRFTRFAALMKPKSAPAQAGQQAKR